MSRLLRAGLCAVLVLCCMSAARADIFKYVDGNGVTHFTNVPSHSGYQVVIGARPSGGGDESAYDGLIHSLCRQHGLDAALVKAVVKAESNFNPRAVSCKGARGLMQLMPEKARELRVADPFDPRENLQAGISHLHRLLELFDGNVRLALAAYNAGENAVLRCQAVPPYEETRTYIEKVLRFQKRYAAHQ